MRNCSERCIKNIVNLWHKISSISSTCLIFMETRTELIDGSIKQRSASLRATTTGLRRSSLLWWTSASGLLCLLFAMSRKDMCEECQKGRSTREVRMLQVKGRIPTRSKRRQKKSALHSYCEQELPGKLKGWRHIPLDELRREISQTEWRCERILDRIEVRFQCSERRRHLWQSTPLAAPKSLWVSRAGRSVFSLAGTVAKTSTV